MKMQKLLLGYGVEDSGKRFNLPDHEAVFGMCAENTKPLTLKEAVFWKKTLEKDAKIIAFFESENEEVVI